MFVTYVLYSEKFNQLYIGYTSDLMNRFHSHNSFATKGHTIKYRPWIVAYVEFHETKNQALTREKQRRIQAINATCPLLLIVCKNT